LYRVGLKPHQVVVVSGIGCRSNPAPGLHQKHLRHAHVNGRGLGLATRRASWPIMNPVIATGGDGDGFGIGGNPFPNTSAATWTGRIRVGQSDLRADHRPDFAYKPQWDEDQKALR